MTGKIDISKIIKSQAGLHEQLKKIIGSYENKAIKTKGFITILKSDIKLPPITIPKFDGSYQTCRSFYDLFNSIIYKDLNLTKIQKLHYLKSCVTGEAERLLRQFDITDCNYLKAWEFLEKRYNNKRVLVQNHIKRLVHQLIIRKESAQSIKSLIDQTEEVLHELSTLEVQTTNWDTLLIYMLSQKLPNETLYSWERELGGTTDLPTYKKFIGFLESRFRMLEALQSNHSDYQNTSLNQQNKFIGSSHRTTKTFMNKTRECLKCKANHALYSCPHFKNLDTNKRLEFVQHNKLCNNCLSGNHPKNKCPSKLACYRCNQRHHTLLHLNVKESTWSERAQKHIDSKSNATKSEATKSKQESVSVAGPSTTNFFNSNSTNVLLATALVKVNGSNGQSSRLRAIIDSGSQVSFITKTAAQRLKLQFSKTNVQVTGLEKTNTARVYKQAFVKIRSMYSNYQIKTKVFVINEITDSIPSLPIDASNLSYIENLKLADPQFASPGPVDLLLGADIYGSIIKIGIIKGTKNQPTAQATELGWILIGPIPSHKSNNKVKTFLTSSVKTSLDQLNQTLKKFWELEEINPKIPLSPEDQLCEDIYRSSVKRNVDGRYEVSLPFKNNTKPTLGESKHIAVKQFLQLEKRFEKQSDFYDLYSQQIH